MASSLARIAVVTSAPPFAEGGHLVIARALVDAVREYGHEAALITTPSNRFGHQASAYLANWLTDVQVTGDGRPIDQVISLRFPSYAVRHPRHACWLNHTMREYYDLWDRFSAPLSPQGRLKEEVRRFAMHKTDTYLFKHNVTKLFAQSATVQARLARWNGVSSDVVYPPPPQRAYRCDAYDDYLFVVSRLTPMKRIDLVLDALATAACRSVRCVIGGEGEDRARLEKKLLDLGLADRVTLVGRVSEDELVAHYARCRAVCFVPRDEDFGFVTVEAFASGKAVITCSDSGAPAELVVSDRNGLVSAPDASSLGTAIARVMEDQPLAERMGASALTDVAALTWPVTVARLLLV